MDVANQEVGLAYALGLVAPDDVEDVVLHVLTDDVPGTSAQTEPFPLADGVEP